MGSAVSGTYHTRPSGTTISSVIDEGSSDEPSNSDWNNTCPDSCQVGRSELLFIERAVAVVIAQVCQKSGQIARDRPHGTAIPHRRRLVAVIKKPSSPSPVSMKHHDRLTWLQMGLQIRGRQSRGKMKLARHAAQAQTSR